MALELLDLTIGLTQISIAAALVSLVRFRHGVEWLLLLGAFFALRGVVRVLGAAGVDDVQRLDPALEVLVLVMMLLLAIGVRRHGTTLANAEDAADMREIAYGRALTEYRILLRHRIANPLTAISGGVATLLEVDTLSESQKREILRLLETETARLKKVALTPVAVDAAERRFTRVGSRLPSLFPQSRRRRILHARNPLSSGFDRACVDAPTDGCKPR